MKELKEILEQALNQAETIPVFEKPGNRSLTNQKWLVNNQRQWTIHYIKEAIAKLDED